MIRQVVHDEFYDNQPERAFVKTLSEYEFASVKFREPKSLNAVKVRGVKLDKGVFEKEVNLEPLWFDFDKFLEKNDLKGQTFSVELKKADGYEKEEYEIIVTDNGATVTAGEIEGIRRGVLELEDMIVKGFGNLEKGTTRQKTIIKRRISRGFFAPINRPPKGANELGDDTDYYPDAYLNRMMHDGVNALWLYTDFDSIVESSYIPEFGKGREKPLKKLNALVERVAKFGMEIFIFLIAPMSLFEPAIANKYPGIAKKYPQVHGNSSNGPTAFCVYTEFGAGYLKEASERLMKAAPGVAGIMSITLGERTTSCGNSWPTIDGDWVNNCPHCKDKTKMDSITRTVQLFKEGMNEVNPKYDFISWTYGMRGTSDERMEEYFKKIDPTAISMVNFEDDGRVFQLGKKRFAFDYYLCYAGPSAMYKRAANYAKKYNKELYAKMQICCSHEIASVPYIPVPGIIYDKMTGAKATGTTGVMECWFFGSYPCMMSKSVGMLSGDKEYANKQEFLFDLAKLYWAEEDVPHAVSAWEYFEKAYVSYPMNVMFNYYGPMHDGIVWDLWLKPKNFSLPRTWQLQDKTDGDRIGECYFYGHTLDELITLTEDMVYNWKKGLERLMQTSEWNNTANEQINIAKALMLLFESGHNILKFYRARQDLGYCRGDAQALLDQMKEIVYAEIKRGEDMIPLCVADGRLGWHSEAEGYKFHPEKLKFRIANLKKLLETEFVEVQQRIDNGEYPLEYYLGVEPEFKRVTAGRNGIESAEWTEFGNLEDGKGKCAFRIAEDGDDIVLELKADDIRDNFFVTFETELMCPQNTYVFKSTGEVKLWREGASHQSVNDERHAEFSKFWTAKDLSDGTGMHVIGRVSKKDIQFIRFPFKLAVRFFRGASWMTEPHCMGTLGRNRCSPGEFGWID